MIKLIVGLGNPGTEYEATRHNAGFWWVDAAARALGARLVAERAYFGLVARVNRPEGPLWLLQPQTFMNLSGKSVAALARFFKIAPPEILVVHDELDLPTGQLKLKQGGGHGGHNGLRDLHAQLGSADYWRLRLGIGHPGTKAEVVDYVLRKPPSDQREAIEKAIIDSLAALDLLIGGQMDKAVMKLHAKPPRPKPPRPVAAPLPAAPAAAAAAEGLPHPKPEGSEP
ncbi:MAG: aminoacyl-tRNA hydrolase [Rubrivivax sp.]|nr:aminoacyl-tRNA hydrolase [Rubrivivax sp.]